MSVKMHRYCVNFCVIVVLGLCIYDTNGQTNATTNTTLPTANIKPFSQNIIYQTGGFSSDSITSGPLLVIDKKTIFISNVNYKSIRTDTHFWAGVGKPSTNGALVPDENDSESPLKSYQGQNIYLQLPENLTTDKIDYIAVWSIQNKTDLGHIVLYKEDGEGRNHVPEALGYHKKTKDDKTIFRIPTCCEVNEISLNKNCIPAEADLELNMTVFESNGTHIDPDKLMDNIEFVPYKYFTECAEKNSARIILEEGEALGLIYNESLLYYLDPYAYGALSHGSFCVSYRNITEQNIVMCIHDVPSTAGASIQYLYLPFLVISTICFFTSAVIYIFILKAKDIHKKCFVGYCISMVVTFISLIFLQKMNAACNFMGGLFMFSMICSFVWLACLSIDLIYVVKSPGESAKDNTRIYGYLSFSLAVPVIILGSSLIPDGIPDVPESFIKTYSGSDTCYFGDVNIKIFFIPIGLLILVSLAGLGYTSWIINTHNNIDDYEFRQNKSRFKFMLIQCSLICIIMTLSFGTWLGLNLFDVDQKPEGFLLSLILLQYMQGILIVLIIFGHNWGNKVMEQRKCKNNKNQQTNNSVQQNGHYEMTPLSCRGQDLTLLLE